MDLDKLSREFGIDESELEGLEDNDEKEVPTEESLMPENESVDINDPDKILEDNINKANKVLDKIIYEMSRGSFSARMGEVAGQLVNAVTNAVDKVFARDAGIKNLLIKDKMLGLKEKETGIKERLLEMKGKKEGKDGKEKLLITDRETILKILNKENQYNGEDSNDNE